MTQLRIDLSAIKARMRLSRKRLFLIVEGKTDLNIYETLVENILVPKGITYHIYKVEEFKVKKGGKDGIVEMFEYLKSSNSLTINDGPSKTDCLLFLDKDIDDILGTQISNDHVIYTRYYTVENELFINGDLKKSLSVALDIRAVDVDKIFVDKKKWLYDLAVSWKEWISICIFVRLKQLNYGANFSRPSTIHAESGIIKDQEYKKCISDIKNNSKFTDMEFEREFNNVNSLVEQKFNSDTLYHSVFPGKWFFIRIETKIKTELSGNDITVKSFQDKLRSNLIMSLSFEDEFVNYYRKALHFIDS